MAGTAKSRLTCWLRALARQPERWLVSFMTWSPPTWSRPMPNPYRMTYVVKDGAPRAQCGCGWFYVKSPSGESIYAAAGAHQEEEHS
jgi:hypothetical protein